MAIAEKNLTSNVELVATEIGHGKINADLMQINPIGKIPTLDPMRERPCSIRPPLSITWTSGSQNRD